MQIQIYQGINKMMKSADITVVIDVIRAFTVAHYAFIRGADRIYLAETVEQAVEVKNRNPEYLLAGEVDGYPITGFDLDNSPFRISKENLSGKTIVQRTTNGVRATLNCLDSAHLFVTGYSNARKTAEFIKKNHMKEDTEINIVASHPTGEDDYACAEYIQSILAEDKKQINEYEVKRKIINSHVAKKFLDVKHEVFKREDLLYCIKELDSGFVMRVNTDSEIPMIERVQVC
ncbi:2-phosphosulfolactate phosphatase [Gracilibacillus ureilyticus]|uniref:Probable 2-phosphosulfolactate phosphatase n=1 Tax=Gracilibacillus ureilyticus TaxID=531814 RepID=A0A1H9TCJ5_9BACI|nr:2-phosphosulfolactate phosphatase [Gracilibacillus ureilyticus]SER94674.1 2-phosphosulfolactate phosphatase [Gracilibacillus ureilyticus]